MTLAVGPGLHGVGSRCQALRQLRAGVARRDAAVHGDFRSRLGRPLPQVQHRLLGAVAGLQGDGHVGGSVQGELVVARVASGGQLRLAAVGPASAHRLAGRYGGNITAGRGRLCIGRWE